jgi:hypothetical protein
LMEAVVLLAAVEMVAEARGEAVVDEAVTAVEATEAVVVMAAEEIEAEARAEAVMVVAAMAEGATAEAVKVVEKAVAKEAVVMMAADTVAAREAEEMAVEMEAAAREEASAAVIWEVGNQEGHSNGHSPLQRGSSPYSACAMMPEALCTGRHGFSSKTSRALQSYEPTRREGSPSAHEASHSTRQHERLHVCSHKHQPSLTTFHLRQGGGAALWQSAERKQQLGQEEHTPLDRLGEFDEFDIASRAAARVACAWALEW